ncbi:2-isopropylmalate synthase (Alpha-isopropylmalate synthase) (Alpha-IPM synthetase) [Blastocladiella emersonii ATCC 22665]|nr:2-isopropylmalate synthase (Alpha-isopropylmalate synthase) (Alpha-IPM synthetase) [Blastocladiella emersonii ATCC 22665]
MAHIPNRQHGSDADDGELAHAAAKEHLYIFDSTLRDGEQSPGVTLHVTEKVEIARQLSKLGVDICEAGFPIASDGDFEAVARIAREVGPLMVNRERIGRPMRICGLARATRGDIQRAYDAVHHAPLHRIHTFLATSDIHLEHKLRISRDECVRRATEAVAFARSLVDDVEFSPEDAGRSDPDFLCRVLGAVIDAGATVLNIPDTVGYNTPEDYGRLIAYLIAHTPGAGKVIWSTHCHNDLGLATANTLAGVRAGARQVEVTINGIGERAGNTSAEEVVMALCTHPKSFPVTTLIDTKQIFRTSQLVSQRTGMVVQPNKAIVGANAFAHESGIHQDGVLKHAATYEIIDPATVGVPSNALVLGKHSGRNAFRTRIQQLGYSLTEDEFQRSFARFKRTADAKKAVTDSDIVAIVEDELGVLQQPAIELRSVQVSSGTGVIATATVELVVYRAEGETVLVDAAISRNGPIHAIFKAVERLVEVSINLLHYEVRAVSAGGDGDALGQVAVKLANEAAPHVHYNGTATDTDVVMASARAFVAALNRMLLQAPHAAKTPREAMPVSPTAAEHAPPASRKVDI